MKKHDEGYVLAYVMVIIAILALIAASVHSVALNNLQKQQAEVEKMQAKYAAQGMVEQVIAEFEAISTNTLISHISVEGTTIYVPEESVSGNTCNIVVTAVSEPVIITCELKLENKSTITPGVDGQSYLLDKIEKIDYVSYKISTAEEAGGGGDT